MVTGMDSLLAHQRRRELAREIDSGRLARKPRVDRRPGHGLRWALWRLPEAETAAGEEAPPKIRHLRDAGVPART